MGEDSDVEEEDVDEEEPYEPTDTSSMPDGNRTIVLGGWSKIETVEDALVVLQTEIIKTLLVHDGEYGPLPLNSELSGLKISGSSSVVFKGKSCIMTPNLFIRNVSFMGEEGSTVLKISCEAGKAACNAQFTNCQVSGGRNSIEVHTHARPLFVACSITNPEKCCLYSYPRSRPNLCAGYKTITRTSIFASQPVEGADPPPLPISVIPEDVMVHLLEQDKANPKLWKISYNEVEGYADRAALNYTDPQRCSLVGEAIDGSVGVLLDESDCQLRETDISGFQTGCYTQGRCKNTNIEQLNISKCTGIGIHLTAGSRVGVRSCRIGSCDHYGLRVSKGKESDDKELSVLCKQRMDALANDEFDVVKTIEEMLKSKQITYNDMTLTWSKSDGSGGCWGHDETHSILRNNVFLSDVRIGKDTLPSLFENTIVSPSKLISDIPFVVNGYKITDKEPKLVVLTRDEEE